jgi:hypothetical protein
MKSLKLFDASIVLDSRGVIVIAVLLEFIWVVVVVKYSVA